MLDYLLEWFREVCWGRQVGAHGYQALSWTEVRAWATATDRRLKPYEYRALMMLDAASRHPRSPDERMDAEDDKEA